MKMMQKTNELLPVSDEILALFDQVCREAEAEVTALCTSVEGADPKGAAPTFGQDGSSSIESGLEYVSNILRAAMRYSETEILRDELEWGVERLPGFEVSPEMVRRNIDRYTSALESRMPKEGFAAIRPYLEIMQRMQQSFIMPR